MNNTLAHADTQDRTSQPIGQIAVELPGFAAIFHRLRPDFCCCGHIARQQTCESKVLDVDAVLAELARLERLDAPVVPQALTKMIDHTLTHHERRYTTPARLQHLACAVRWHQPVRRRPDGSHSPREQPALCTV